jgi:Family of unknown function (DUF6166)
MTLLRIVIPFQIFFEHDLYRKTGAHFSESLLERQESRMKHYVGDRTIDGVKVTVDGVPLDPATSVAEYSKNGFEWSYEGPEPRQLALALLVDHLGDKDAAKAAVEGFMQAVVANFGNEWEMTSDDIALALTALPGKAVA